MTDEVKVPTPGEEAAADKPAETPAEETPKTMEQIQEEAVPKALPKETVGLDKFLEIKKQNKEFKKTIDDLTKKIEEGATSTEVTTSLESIAEEYPDVDPKFLNKLATAIRAQVKKDAEADIAARVGPLEKKDRDAKIDAAFTKHFNAAMEAMPEFKGIVNAAVIKKLSLDPENKNKTFKQLIEETYGDALTGKRTIESTVPGGGKDTDPLDFAKARKDPAYFDIVMANPRLKAEYNEKMLKEGF